MSTRTLVNGLSQLRSLDDLAQGDSVVHRLDARAKVLVTAGFLVAIMSFDARALAPLVPFAAFPATVLAIGRLPVRPLLRSLGVVLGLAVLVALPNPFFDREVAYRWGSLSVTGGWVSLVSIVLRSGLAASAALLLVAVTGFPALADALGRLGLPRVLAEQLLLLHRYIGLLTEETTRAAQARELRGLGRPLPMRHFAPLAGSLLLRSWARAERVHQAMRARGFDGRLPISGSSQLGSRDWAWLCGWLALFATMRAIDFSSLLGRAAISAWGWGS